MDRAKDGTSRKEAAKGSSLADPGSVPKVALSAPKTGQGPENLFDKFENSEKNYVPVDHNVRKGLNARSPLENAYAEVSQPSTSGWSVNSPHAQSSSTRSAQGAPVVDMNVLAQAISQAVEGIGNKMSENFDYYFSQAYNYPDNSDQFSEVDNPDDQDTGVNVEDPGPQVEQDNTVLQADVSSDQAAPDLMDDVLKSEFNHYKGGEQPGPPLKDKNLVTLVTDMLEKDLSADALTQKMNRYNRPENIKGLNIMKINKPLWKKVSPDTKNRDLKVQAFQKILLKSMVPITQILDQLLESKVQNVPIDTGSTLQKTLDAMSLLCQVNRDINKWRKTNLQPDMAAGFKQLCFEQSEDDDGGYLFDNLEQKLKTIKETESLTSALRGNFGGFSHRRPMARFRGQDRRFTPYQHRPMYKGYSPGTPSASRRQAHRGNKPQPSFLGQRHKNGQKEPYKKQK